MFPANTAAALAAALTLASIPGFSFDNSSSTALIWQGYQHSWTYNHRINRFGDYIKNQSCRTADCTATVEHTAASGSGPDTAAWKSRYVTVSAPGVRFLPGLSRLVVRGSEGVTNTATNFVSVNAPESMRGRNAKVLINGFDILAIPPNTGSAGADADLVEDFDLQVSDAIFAPATNKLEFVVSSSFKGACTSAECSIANQRLDYQIDVQYLIVSADPTKAVTHATQTLSRSYAWPENNLEITPDNAGAAGVTTLNQPLPATSQFTRLVLGIQRISTGLDRHHHLLGWDSFLQNVSYTPSTGAVSVFQQLFFKQWRFHMNDTYPFYGSFAFDEDGSAQVSMSVAPITFDGTACVKAGFADGSFEAPTGAGASTGDAIDGGTFTYSPGGVCGGP